VVIEQALEVVHDGLRSQGWWSAKWDVITSIRRSESSWVVARTRRRYAESGDILDRRIGGFGPVVVTDRGDIIPPEGSVKIDHVDESGVATVAARTEWFPQRQPIGPRPADVAGVPARRLYR
jgi:hypothetical protein